MVRAFSFFPPVYPIHFGSPLLEKISTMAGAHPPPLEAALPFEYLKQGGYDHLIRDQFEFYKTTGRVSGFGEVKTPFTINQDMKKSLFIPFLFFISW
ncbi:MAG: hypothetical protein JRE58_10820 [Deltaproteobacteria bacterium]|nr:hypothetical protein [Deltaproteobacteria bacterium]